MIGGVGLLAGSHLLTGWGGLYDLFVSSSLLLYDCSRVSTIWSAHSPATRPFSTIIETVRMIRLVRRASFASWLLSLESRRAFSHLRNLLSSVFIALISSPMRDAEGPGTASGTAVGCWRWLDLPAGTRSSALVGRGGRSSRERWLLLEP